MGPRVAKRLMATGRLLDHGVVVSPRGPAIEVHVSNRRASVFVEDSSIVRERRVRQATVPMVKCVWRPRAKPSRCPGCDASRRWR